MVGVVTVT